MERVTPTPTRDQVIADAARVLAEINADTTWPRPTTKVVDSSEYRGADRE